MEGVHSRQQTCSITVVRVPGCQGMLGETRYTAFSFDMDPHVFSCDILVTMT